MPRIRKCFIHGSVVEISFRAEQGLVLPSNLIMRLVLLSILARAQQSYPITICHYTVMSNHLHLIIVVDDPNNVPRFIEYFKRETALAINRMLGRVKHTVWEAGYASPVVLDAGKVMERLSYFYTNPQNARLVRKIEDYPHLNSWKAFMVGGIEQEVPYFRRTAIPKALKQGEGNSKELEAELLKRASGSSKLKITPFAWMPCFYESDGASEARIRDEVIRAVRKIEEELDAKHGEGVLGREELKGAEIELEYVPKKRSAKSICLSTKKELRQVFIGWYKAAATGAKSLVKLVMAGARSVAMPPGFFAPGGLLHSYINPVFTPLPLA